MRELNTSEISEVSGGLTQGLADSVEGAINMGLLSTVTLTIVGGMHGGNNGGVIGLGLIGNGVGAVLGIAYGLVGGTIIGALEGQSGTAAYQQQMVTGITSGALMSNQQATIA